ncbi:unnamed protein product [Cylicocyclus nassatus]|uniref:Uncharacterized protein n=1 Tax=Cylicocyclus nassatus TaxID=53992 RepID=A0AA36M9W0_CYLNA|nr:unnamed protein product [Cylicocyclus nassatus]
MIALTLKAIATTKTAQYVLCRLARVRLCSNILASTLTWTQCERIRFYIRVIRVYYRRKPSYLPISILKGTRSSDI